MEMVLGPERSTETAHVGQLVGLSGEGAMKSQSQSKGNPWGFQAQKAR
jgi:hypothetical protein